MLIDVSKFGGMAPKILDPALLAPNRSQTALNCRFDRGGITPLNTDELIETLSTTDVIHSIYTYYTGTITVLQYFFRWATDVNAVKAPIANDSYGRVYYTEDGYLKVTDGTLFNSGGTDYPMHYYLPCPPAPTNAPTISGTPTGSDPTLLETRGYVYTFVNGYGEEGPPSPVSNLLDIYDGDTVNVTGMDTIVDPIYNVLTKRIYRINQATGGAAQFQYVDEIPVANSTYSDTVLDAALGEILPSAEWDQPPVGLRGLIALPNGVLAGFVDNLVCFSVPWYPHAWPVRYQKACDRYVIGLGAFGTTVVALTEGQPYLIIGNDPENTTMEKMDLGLACLSKRGIVNIGNITIYPSPEGLIGITPSGIENLTKDLLTKDQWLSQYNPAAIAAFHWEGKYVAFYDTAPVQYPPPPFAPSGHPDVPPTPPVVPVNSANLGFRVYDACLDGNYIYAVGIYYGLDGSQTQALAVINTTDLTSTIYYYDSVASTGRAFFMCVAVDNDYIYTGGQYVPVGSAYYNWDLKKINKTDPNTTIWSKHIATGSASYGVIYQIDASDPTYLYVVGQYGGRGVRARYLKSDGSQGWKVDNVYSAYYGIALYGSYVDCFGSYGGYKMVDRCYQTTGAIQTHRVFNHSVDPTQDNHLYNFYRPVAVGSDYFIAGDKCVNGWNDAQSLSEILLSNLTWQDEYVRNNNPALNDPSSWTNVEHMMTPRNVGVGLYVAGLYAIGGIQHVTLEKLDTSLASIWFKDLGPYKTMQWAFCVDTTYLYIFYFPYYSNLNSTTVEKRLLSTGELVT